MSQANWQATEVITFDASGSTDGDGDTLTYSWDFGDGAVGSGVSTTHSYSSGGTFTVTLSANDGYHSGTDTVELTIAPPPYPPLTSPQDGTANLSTFEATFRWEGQSGDLQLSLDDSFQSLETFSVLSSSLLSSCINNFCVYGREEKTGYIQPAQTYYWRVAAQVRDSC